MSAAQIETQANTIDNMPFNAAAHQDNETAVEQTDKAKEGAPANGESAKANPILPPSDHCSLRCDCVPTESYLSVQPSAENPYTVLLAKQAVEDLGESGSNADGMETDSSGYIYAGAPEHNVVTRYNPATRVMEPFVRAPYIQNGVPGEMLRSFSFLALWAAVTAAQATGSVFDFPEYPHAGTPDPNSTFANAVAPLPSSVAKNPTLAGAYIHYDTGLYGPKLELVHAYYNYWPVGVGVASDGTVFTTLPRGNETFTLAVFNSTTTEAPWPNEDWNTPPAFENASNPGYSVVTEKFLYIQSVVVDGLDRVWALDTGRPEVNGSYLLAAVPGGPKLIGFYLNGTNFAAYTFPSSVVYADSSVNDVRFDLRGGGYAYITDSSPNHPGIVVLELATGASWRHLDAHPSTTPDNSFVPVYDGVPFYLHPITAPYAVNNFGLYAADGIALSPDGAYLYYAPLASRQLWRVPTSYLKVQPSAENPYAALLAKQAVENLGESGSNADGMETDSSGYIYAGAPEHNAVTRYNPATGVMEPFVRAPYIQWPDTLSIVTLQTGESYVYFTCNQLWLGPNYQNGTDLRTKPYAMFRAPIEANKAAQTD
ncbi:uncharacterized protein LAESUDRAFT_758604 [Laetiporus sulphureus 93-53]|uniref:Major royal jelly protein n=1 Tax=Laetiporus sulphureus 93-53 TaxID=1314785 RepID=A0A165EJJ4_9APHY|nr:uncharacterized protein LAESUDRAFT_758604 [Laetiporus sulphureus 93-53]KZT07183.1 hypothetical protein LAESUDRAFT_758604 [Laetiporus sulphureus 93-53]